MEYETDLDIENARQAYRALKLSPIADLPAYSASAATTCRVGRMISAFASCLPWNTLIATDLLQVLGNELRALPSYPAPFAEVTL